MRWETVYWGHSHSAATHLAMLTFFASLATMKGCCSSCQGYGRSVPDRIRLHISCHLTYRESSLTTPP